MKRIVCFGPGPQFKGGIANYNTSLAKAFDASGDVEVHIVSWTQQYPAIIPRDFIDRKSRQDQLKGTGIKVHYITNYNNPFSWIKTTRLIKNLKPDLVVFQWAIAIQGLPLGYIAGKLIRSGHHVVFDLHFVKQKEGSTLDILLTKFGIKNANSYVVHARQTADELSSLFSMRTFTLVEGAVSGKIQNPVLKLYHPVYDMFKPDPDFNKELVKSQMGLKENVFLFFGFIRKYKGLHLAIEAFAKLASMRNDVSLLIVGESFWDTLDNKKFTARLKNRLFGIAKKIFLRKQDDERDYNPLRLIDDLNIRDKVVVVNDFVPNEEVHRYFQVSDNLLLFYLTATPSGVESIGYNFRMPMLASSVGHFPETVQNGVNGYLAVSEDTNDMLRIMNLAIVKPIDRKNIESTAQNMSWHNYARSIMSLTSSR